MQGDRMVAGDGAPSRSCVVCCGEGSRTRARSRGSLESVDILLLPVRHQGAEQNRVVQAPCCDRRVVWLLGLSLRTGGRGAGGTSRPFKALPVLDHGQHVILI